MGDGFSLRELGGDCRDFCTSIYERAQAKFNEETTEPPLESTSPQDPLEKSAAEDLKLLERRLKLGEKPVQPEVRKEVKAEPQEEPEPKAGPKKFTTGLTAPEGDEHLAKEYQGVDQELGKMVSQAKASIHETLGLPEGSPLPQGMTLKFGVSRRPGAPQDVRLVSVKANPGFRYRVNGGIPRYLTSADLSTGARSDVPSVLFPAHVDLNKICTEQGFINIRLNADGSYELIPPEKTVENPPNTPGA